MAFAAGFHEVQEGCAVEKVGGNAHLQMDGAGKLQEEGEEDGADGLIGGFEEVIGVLEVSVGVGTYPDGGSDK